MDFIERVMELKKEKGILITAHRGTSGGNIINNTIPAFENALHHKSDIMELDAAMSEDGVFYCFHDGTEPVLLGSTVNIRKMESSYIDSLRMINPYMALTSERVNKLEDVFEHLRGRCLINVDRSYFYWKEILSFIKKMNMESYIVIKSVPNPEQLKILEDMAPNLAYMPMIRKPEEAECIKNFKINYCMAELMFQDEKDPIVSDEFIGKLKAEGILVWGSSLSIHDWFNNCGGKDDFHAITKDPDEAWGWFVEKGFDIIQTDWPMILREYLDKKLNIGNKASA